MISLIGRQRPGTSLRKAVATKSGEGRDVRGVMKAIRKEKGLQDAFYQIGRGNGEGRSLSMT